MASDLAHTACKQKATLCWSLETTHHFYLLWMAANTDDKELNSTVELIYYTGCSPVVSSPGMWRKKNLLPFSEKEEKVRKMKPDLRLKFSNFNYRWNGCKKKKSGSQHYQQKMECVVQSTNSQSAHKHRKKLWRCRELFLSVAQNQLSFRLTLL